MHAVKLLSGPGLGLQGLLSSPSRGYYLVQVCFLDCFIVFSSDFCTLSYHFVFFFVPNYLAIF